LTVAGPPTVLLAVAAAGAVVGIVGGAIGWGSWMAAIGWAFAGPIAIGVMALYFAKDTGRQAAPVYARPGWLTWAYLVVGVLAAAGIVVSALGVAFWIGHR
jgi:hypothetical protein